MTSIRRLLLPVIIILVALTMPPIVSAQTVAVTGTITDTQTTPYSNGLLTVTFVNATGQQATFGGNPSFQKSYAIYLDANGAFTVNLPPNSIASPSIQPAGTQWNFSYQSQGGYGAANINVTITGAGSISGTLSNLARITWPYGNIPPPGAAGQGIVFVSSTTLGWGTTGGSVTHTGNLTALHLMLGNGLADSTVDSACVTNGTGALSGCTSISAGSGASAAGATATGGFACVEATNTGWTPTAGQDYIRCDSTLHLVASNNGNAETAIGSSALSGLTGATGANTIANGNNPQTWNCALTTDALDCIAFGETSAAINGTLTNGLANQAVFGVSTAANSTATPFEIVQGSITNTVATPMAQFETTWNSAGLHARGLGVSVTNTASNVDSFPLFVNVGNSTLFGVDVTGLGVFNGNAVSTSAPPASTASTTGWKYCLYGVINCTAIPAASQEYHTVNQGASGWFDLGSSLPIGDGTTGKPDTASGFSFFNNALLAMGKEFGGGGTCSGPTVPSAGGALCLDSTPHELLLATNGSSNFGMLVRTQPGAIHVTAQTATKTIYTLCAAAAGACNVAGQYRITWYFNQGGTACGTPTPGQVTFALSWTDNAGAHSAIALPMNDNSSIAVFTSAFKFASTNVTGFASGEFNLWSTGAQPIQITNTYTACGVGTGTWELTAAAERVQ